MKPRIPPAILLAGLLFSTGLPAWAQPTPARSAAHAELDQQMRRQRLIMADMHRQLEALQATSDPNQRERQLQAHLENMQKTLRIMQRMADISMQGHGEDGGRPPGGYGSVPDPEEVHRYAMLKERLDMLQVLLEQIVARERVVWEWAAQSVKCEQKSR